MENLDNIQYKTNDIKVYKTKTELIPFVLNNNGTKIKILTNNQISKIIIDETYNPSPLDDDSARFSLNLYATLKKVTKKSGKIYYDMCQVLNECAVYSPSTMNVLVNSVTSIMSQSKIIDIFKKTNRIYNLMIKDFIDGRDF